MIVAVVVAAAVAAVAVPGDFYVVPLWVVDSSPL